MWITALHTYPVKGCHRLDHDEARVEPLGLAGDRRWMMVDADGVGITQRQAPHLTGLTVRPRPGGLRLSAPGLADLDLDEPAEAVKVPVRVFSNREPVPARLADSAWSSAFLGRDARLVWLADPTARPITSHARPGDRVSFADGFPILAANAASLTAVNDWLAEEGEEPVPIHRFRPNLVIGGAPAWAEDGWPGRRLRIGELVYRVARESTRCRVITVDQETGVTGRQPLHVLGRYRRFPTGLHFGVNLIPDLPPGQVGVIRAGETVVLAES